jgi:uncharacterized protein
MAKYNPPGVYIVEKDVFSNSIEGIATSIPVFIGYTQQAAINGKAALNQAIQIASMNEYEDYFGKGLTTTCTIAPQSEPKNCDFVANGVGYNIELTANTVYNLYKSLQLFYANGGGTCYVVSVGGYDAPISATNILNGLNAANNIIGPTMLVVPDAVLLPNANDFATVCNAMLNQCATLQSLIAIVDVYDGTSPFAPDGTNPAIINFWQLVDTANLSYGAAYFPFLNTTINTASNISYTQFLNTDLLAQILAPQLSEPFAQLQSQYDTAQLSQYLQNTVPIYQQMVNILLTKINVLPPSAAMAGVYTATDNNKGVWNAPANVSLASVANPAVPINDAQQGTINVPLNGMAINAIRNFVGRGAVVWGARTLDGNSNDWRYISVRRTIIYIEQSIKLALQQYVFAANDSITWANVNAAISNFLTGLWQQGGLLGDKASDAYTVQVGLGSTMTGQDILNGYMIVNVTLCLIHPAEFIELTFTQTMQGV